MGYYLIGYCKRNCEADANRATCRRITRGVSDKLKNRPTQTEKTTTGIATSGVNYRALRAGDGQKAGRSFHGSGAAAEDAGHGHCGGDLPWHGVAYGDDACLRHIVMHEHAGGKKSWSGPI